MKRKQMITTVLATAMMVSGNVAATDISDQTITPETMQIEILATSDMHGKFVPYDYALNAESLSGSTAQIASAVEELRTENTIIVDGGENG